MIDILKIERFIRFLRGLSDGFPDLNENKG